MRVRTLSFDLNSKLGISQRHRRCNRRPAAV